jgi:outer membrane protein TolC
MIEKNIFWAVICLFLSTAVSAAEVSFDVALASISKNDTDVERARLDFESASEAYQKSAQRYLPSVVAEASMMRQKDVGTTRIDAGIEAGIDANLNMFRFGGDGAIHDAKNFLRKAAEEVYLSSKAQAEWRAAKILLDLLEAKEAVEVERKFISLKKSSLVTIEKLFKSGTRPAQDVEKLTLDVLSEEDRMAKLELMYDKAFSSLHKVAPETQVVGVWPWTANLLNSSPEKWPAKMAQAPAAEVAVSKYKVSAMTSAVTEKRASLLPTLDLQGKYLWGRTNLQSRWQPAWTAALVLKMPIYDRGSNYFGLHEAERELSNAKISLTEKERDAPELRATAQKQLASAIAALRNRESLTSRSRKLYDQSMLAFARGVLGVNDLLDDQSRLVRAEQAASEAAALAHHSLLDFCTVMNLRISECVN